MRNIIFFQFIESGDDFTTTIAEKSFGEFNVPPVTVTNEDAILATHTTFGN
jgi:hypothetical protein